MSLKYTLVLLLALAFSASIIADDEYHHGKLPYGGKGKPPLPHKPPHGKPPTKEEELNSKVSSISSSYHKPPHKKHPPNHKSPTTTTVENNNEAAYIGDEYYKPHAPKHGHHHEHPPVLENEKVVKEGNYYKSPKDKPRNPPHHKPPTAN